MTVWCIDVRRGAGRVEVYEAENSDDSYVVGHGGCWSGAIYRWDPVENRWTWSTQFARHYNHPANRGSLLCRDGEWLDPSVGVHGEHHLIVYSTPPSGLCLFFNESIQYHEDGNHICMTEQVVFVVPADGLRPYEVPRSEAPPDLMDWTSEARLFERRTETVSGVSLTNRYTFEPDRPQE